VSRPKILSAARVATASSRFREPHLARTLAAIFFEDEWDIEGHGFHEKAAPCQVFFGPP
jgi:hypothetical protein